MYPIHLFGEVLFDAFPDGSRILGGAPFNVAWHLQALGLQPHFISRIGQDENGKRIRAAMCEWGMSTADLQTDSEHPTGTVAVTIAQGQPSYHILDNQAYDFIQPAAITTDAPSPILYHGTLALRHPVSRHTLTALKQNHQGLVFVDVNLRAPWWQLDEVLEWIGEADWVKLNDEEWPQLYSGSGDIAQDMTDFMQRYDLQGLVITQGERGALALGRQGELAQVRPERVETIVDTVGAGDAFAAVLLVGLAKQWPLPLTLQRAQTFASAIVGQRGATVADLSFYQAFNWL